MKLGSTSFSATEEIELAHMIMQGHPQWGSQEQLSYAASAQPKGPTTSNNLYHIEIGPSQN